MNREQLLRQAPTNRQFTALHAVHKQLAVADLAIAALDSCAAGENLDAWESHCLRGALGALYTNFFDLAWTEVLLAMTPAVERSPGWDQRLAHDIPSIDAFRTAFDQARHRPVPG